MGELEEWTEGNESDCSDSTTYSEFAEDPPNKKYKCPYLNCGKKFFRPSKLDAHKRTHTGEKPFKCNISNCEKSYHTNQHLKKHQDQVHFKNIQYTVCPHEGCGLKLRQSSLVKHMLRKHNEFRQPKFKCKECNKGFRSIYELENHATTHCEVIRCDICFKEFNDANTFKRHKKRHKTYECLCQEKFSDYNNYRTHRKNCEFTRPKCEICDQTFVNKYNLKVHIELTHLRTDDVYKCSFEGCEKQYCRKSSLKLHVAEIHNKKEQDVRYVCSVCSLVLKTRQYLWRHMKNIHINENRKNKEPRAARWDKNLPRVPMLTTLTGIAHNETEDIRLTYKESTNSVITESSPVLVHPEFEFVSVSPEPIHQVKEEIDIKDEFSLK